MNIGNVVRAKHGGPKMTVIGTHEDMAHCMWFDSEDHLQSGKFPEDSLELVRE